MTFYIKSLLKLSAFWYCYFIALKIIFLAYHYSIFSGFTSGDIARVFISGTLLDISFIAYILLLPAFLYALAAFIQGGIVQKIIYYYTLGLSVLITFLMVVDLEVLKWWGIRADITILKYVSQVPAEILATISVVPVYGLIFLFAVVMLLFYAVNRYFLHNAPFPDIHSGRIVHLALFTLFTGLLIIPARGGLQQIPINQSSAYFSYHHHLNLAAVNLAWNFGNSLFDKSAETLQPYTFEPVENGSEMFEALYAKSLERDSVRLLRTTTPNILLIIWESFTYKVIEDSRNLVPGFNRLKKEGMFFPNLYATGDRSDKGLTGILSAYPALPRFSVMNKPEKSAKLPSLNRKLLEKGYSSAFYYGGEPDFANLKSYLLTSRYGQLITKQDFPPQTRTSKWGVHDEHLFNRLATDMDQYERPFFITVFTLSSHEPYDVPLTHIAGENNESRFCNSMYYTDSCLTNFIENARMKDWWDNTLIVIIADHGHIFPGGDQWATRAIEEFRVPMLWTGGALARAGVVDVLGSQTDLAATLLAQLDMDYNDFRFSKDLLNPAKEFAFYTFNNGFGFITPDDYLVYDNVGNHIIHRSDTLSETTIQMGKSYQEVSFRDYLEK